MPEVTPFESGGPLRPQEPAQDGHLLVRGGVAGISFQLEELGAGARGLDGLARELAAVEAAAYRIWSELGQYQNDPPSSGVESLTATWEGRRAVAAVRAELQDIGSQVQACLQEYEAAEYEAASQLRLSTDSLKLVLPQLQDAFPGGAADPLSPDISRLLNRDSSEALTGSYPLMLAALLGTNPLLVGKALAMAAETGMEGTGTPLVTRALVEGVRPDLMPRPVGAFAATSAEVDLEASSAGLLARARSLDEGNPGSIEVIRTASGGREAFIVIVPGTQPGNIGGPNPFDEAGIAEALGYGSEHTSAAIRSALRQAGAEAGAQVVAVGYSQGGIHAMNLSQDKAFLAEYDLKYVLTAGSPVGGITPEPGIASLHLEHRQDWVPGADGAPNPDTRNRVTVTFQDRLLTPPGEDPGLGPGHRLINYEEGARAVAASSDASLAGSTAALAAVVGAGGGATATRFQLVRTPKTQHPFVGQIPAVEPGIRSLEGKPTEGKAAAEKTSAEKTPGEKGSAARQGR
ncbi:MAG: PE-PPE domain-containing protein [Actinomycetota bacterium]|nr:PE-PPE domain-containing protein [Actinomycetota bacterium]